jgi:hypothetical protein
MSIQALECSGMRLLGHNDLGGHGNCGEGTALLCRDGKRYLYLAHEVGPVNFSVLDFTEPTAPQLLAQTKLPHNDVRSNSLAMADGLLIVAYQVNTPGERPAGIEVFDLSRPAEPRSIGALDLSGPHSREACSRLPTRPCRITPSTIPSCCGSPTPAMSSHR